MRYFITVGAGFTGSHSGDRLVETGEVATFDNLRADRLVFTEDPLLTGARRLPSSVRSKMELK